MTFFDQTEPDFSLHIFGEETLVDYRGKRWAIPSRLINYLLQYNDYPAKMIPSGLVAHGIRHNREIWFYHQKPVICPIRLYLSQPRSFDFSWPDLLFVLMKIRDGKIGHFMRVFTFQGPLHAKTVLRLPPLPNISSTGTICMGNIQVATTDPAEFVAQAFFKTAFTHMSLHFEHIKEPITDYLFGVRKTGWRFDDLPAFATLEELIEEKQ